METMTEKELARTRLRFIDLIKSFFIEKPDAEKMSRWRGIFASLDGIQINNYFDVAVQECAQLLAKKSLSDLEDEFYTLFTDPFTEQHVATTASYYIDGRHYGQTLADFRGFLKEVGFAKEEEVIEEEDSLVVLLDILARFIEEEEAGSQCARGSQTKLLVELLEPLADSIYTVLQKDERASFYKSCSSFLKGYIELERSLIMEL